ncbi:hypothetical protein SZ50_08595 [Brachyspira hyodysenteriae]|nr:hypothetical protein SU46_12445 [Brachyspira hyodysenteriae]KLI30345.1 hypothetical protein SZ48_12915 [Brachyspira hyodysenteriae]KLI32300.1 hypothetical protein SZ50_08595 [Brachyspira hyodysenteriae]KLI37568.1 hypothetical protein SZ51_08535 [Brachyspira hyodysenteriae]KLI47197.1 hypothetical protein SZ42_11930 [Brachyspira hyodysenteriae]
MQLFAKRIRACRGYKVLAAGGLCLIPIPKGTYSVKELRVLRSPQSVCGKKLIIHLQKYRNRKNIVLYIKKY